MSKFSKHFVLGFFIFVGIVGGVALGAWIFSPKIPEALKGEQKLQLSTVTEQHIDDAHVLDLSLTVEPSTTLHSLSSGIVTHIAVTPGKSLVSGTPAFSVDSENVIALNSSMPLWRALKEGDTGQDVYALQKELSTLGHPLTIDGKVGSHTLNVVADVLELSVNERKSFDVIEPCRFLWIPYPTTTVSDVSFGVGETIDPSTELFTVEDALVEAKIAQIPQDLIPGERIFVIGNEQLPVNADGIIVGDGLTTLQQTNDFQSWVKDPDNSQPVSGKYLLRDAASVYAVSPAAIYDLNGSLACLTDGQKGFSVTVVSSELGKTLVHFDNADAIPNQVQISPGKEISCK